MKKYFTKFWPLSVIVILWLAFSAPYFVKGLVPFPSSYLVSFFPPWNATHGEAVKNSAMPDTISQIYPWKSFTIETWKNGQIPLWNPYSFSGTVHAANFQSAIFSPLNILFFIFSFIDAWSIAVLLQPLIAGVGMFFFLRSLQKDPMVCSVGAISFMFCGFLTTWMAYGTLGYAALSLPWAFLSVSMDFQKKWGWWKELLAFSLAVSFLSGHFQISIYVFTAVMGYIVFESLRLRRIAHGLQLLIYALLGVAIASPQILITLDAYGVSGRSGSFIKGEVIPWQYIITLFSPDFYGNPVTRNDWFGHYAEWSSYIGVLPLMGAIFGMFMSKNRQRIFFIILMIASFLLAYPTPLVELLFALKIPAISTSAASRIMILFSFALSVLSAFGIEYVVEAWRVKKASKLIPICVSLLFIMLITWGIVLIGHPFPADKLQIAKRNLILPTVILSTGIFLMFLGFLRKKSISIVMLMAIILITGFDMYRYASKWMPFDKRENVYPPVKSMQYLSTYMGNSRVFGNIGNEAGSIFKLHLIEGYDAMYQSRYGEFMQFVSMGYLAPSARSVVQFDKNGLYKTEALQLLGVRYIYHRKSDGQNSWAFPYWEYTKTGVMKQIYSDEDYWIYEYSDVFPRAFLASDYRVIKNDEENIRMLFSPDLNRRETLVLETEPGIRPQSGSGSAEIVSYRANSIEIRTESKVPKLLFLSDVFDAGWNAVIDGKKAPVMRADYDFRAVAVPAGEHTILFKYFPNSLRNGLYITFGSVVLLVLAGFTLKKYENRHL